MKFSCKTDAKIMHYRFKTAKIRPAFTITDVQRLYYTFSASRDSTKNNAAKVAQPKKVLADSSV